MSSTITATLYPTQQSTQQQNINEPTFPHGNEQGPDDDSNTSHFNYILCQPFRTMMKSSECHGSQQYNNSKTTSRKASIRHSENPDTPEKQVLEFVHITKTGGSAVEMAGGKAGLKWGICHFRTSARFGYGCSESRPDWARPQKLQYENAVRNNTPIPNFRGELWHTPPSWFQNNPYQGAATFTIVRNPYTRIISEFYCEFFGYFRPRIRSFDPSERKGDIMGRTPPWNATFPTETLKKLNLNQSDGFMGPTNVGSINTEAGASNGIDLTRPDEQLSLARPKFARRLQEMPDNEIDLIDSTNQSMLSNNESLHFNTTHTKIVGSRVVYASKTEKKKRARLPPPTVATFNSWIQRTVKRINPRSGHMVPQSYYVFDEVNGTTIRYVDHVLKYESLHEEFADLMNRYGLGDVQLGSVNHERKLDYYGEVRFTLSDLEPSTICAINRRYAQDFTNFGYPMRPACSMFESQQALCTRF